MIEAPKLGEVVLITSLMEPPLYLPIENVLGYDQHHEAWKIVVRTREGILRGQLWIKRKNSQVAIGKNEWQVYDIKTPLMRAE